MTEYKYQWGNTVYGIKVAKSEQEGHILASVNGREYNIPLLELKVGFLTFGIDDMPCKAVVTREVCPGPGGGSGGGSAGVSSPTLEQLHVFWGGRVFRLTRLSEASTMTKGGEEVDKEETLASPISGKVVKVLVKPGDHIDEGGVLMILESMKMEYKIPAPYSGTIKAVKFAVEARVNIGEMIVDMDPDEKDPIKRTEARKKMKEQQAAAAASSEERARGK